MGTRDEIRKIQEWKAMLRDIEGNSDNGCFEPSEWEQEFLSSIEDRLEHGTPLTDKQDEILEKIWNKSRE